MRLLEFILLFLLVPAMVDLWLGAKRSTIWRRVVRAAAIAAMLVMVVHWLFEGWRWQMLPAYVLAIACTCDLQWRLCP